MKRIEAARLIDGLEHFLQIAEAMVKRDWDFMSQGIYNTRYIDTYSEEQDREGVG